MQHGQSYRESTVRDVDALSVVSLWQDSLTEPVPLQAGFQFSLFILVQLLSQDKKAQSALLVNSGLGSVEIHNAI